MNIRASQENVDMALLGVCNTRVTSAGLTRLARRRKLG
jgi:hypothetical protein